LENNPYAVRLLEMVMDPDNSSNYGYVKLMIDVTNKLDYALSRNGRLQDIISKND
jgi:hypothetical protein